MDRIFLDIISGGSFLETYEPEAVDMIEKMVQTSHPNARDL